MTNHRIQPKTWLGAASAVAATLFNLAVLWPAASTGHALQDRFDRIDASASSSAISAPRLATVNPPVGSHVTLTAAAPGTTWRTTLGSVGEAGKATARRAHWGVNQSAVQTATQPEDKVAKA